MVRQRRTVMLGEGPAPTPLRQRVAGSKQEMEPQNTRNTLNDNGEDGVNLLTDHIIGCALTLDGEP